MKIVIAGGGTAGFITALILKKRLDVDITMIVPSDIGIIGVGEGSTEHFDTFRQFMGWSIEDVIRKTGATIKAGIMFKNWTSNDYLHSILEDKAYTVGLNMPYYEHIMANRLHPKELTFPCLWENKIENLVDVNQQPLPCSGLRQYHFNTFKLNDFLREEALSLGIEIIDDKISVISGCDKSTRNMHGIKYLKGKKDYYGDLYIDCTGFKRLLIGKLGSEWESFQKFLEMNEAIAFQTPEEDEYNLWTLSERTNNGWIWKIPVQDRYGNGYVYRDLDVDDAVKEIEEKLGHTITVAKHIKFDTGKVSKCWKNNCIAVGLSASFLEPLEASSIGSTIQQAFMLMHRLPHYDDKTISDYNKNVDKMIYNIRDFIALHYTGIPFPDSLSELLEVYNTRLLDSLDFDGQYNMFGAENFNLVAYAMGFVKSDVLKDEKFLLEDLSYRYDGTIKHWSHKKYISMLKKYDHIELVNK